MERNANFALVGAITVALLVGALLFAVWLAEFQFNQKFDVYRIILRGPVSGLSKGGDVQFNGIKVGDIKSISLDSEDPNKVITDIELDPGTPVRVDTMAQLASLGITGVKFVQLTPGTPSKPLLRKVSNDRPPIIMAQRSRMENFVVSTTQLMEGANATVNRLNALLSDSNINTISRSFGDAGAVLAEMRERKAMFAHFEATALELQMLVQSTRLALGDKDQGALKDLALSASELHSTLTSARSTLGKLDAPLSELSVTTLPNLNDTLDSVQRAADSIDRLAIELRQDPHGIINRPRGRQLELPQ